MTQILPPAKNPCGSCPYRRDVPSGIWDDSEYAKLPEYDKDTAFQPGNVFMCHQQDGHLCAGWTAVHDMEEVLGLRLAFGAGAVDPGDIDAILDYTTDVPLFGSGAEAAAHGMRELEAPAPKAIRTITRLRKKLPVE